MFKIYFNGQEEKTVWLSNAAMIITVFISGMGVFGPGMRPKAKPTEQIGLRKRTGASAGHIAFLLSKDFMGPITLSIVLASPVACYIMHQWLQDYAYRTDLQWWILAFSGLSAIVVGLVTYSYQAVNAAAAHPVKRLRTQ